MYLSAFFIFVILVIVVPAFFVWYDKPTCFDNNKNGDEFGVDCGGSCQLLCSFEAIEPDILWSRSFKVVSGMYSATAYISNHNINSEAINVPYVFKLYDSQNLLIASREGYAYTPKNKVFGVFEPNIQVGQKIPTRTTFEFTKTPTWNKNTVTPPKLVVSKKNLTREDIRPRLDATIENKSLIPFSNIEVLAIIYDGKNNAIGASRTYIDSLEKDQSSDVVFTWPAPFDTQSSVCKVPADVMMVIDRSGSMASDGINPPQPLTDVKNAAILFVNQLGVEDKVGLVSYAGEASNPIDRELTKDLVSVKSAIGSIAIGTGVLQQTNISDGLQKALVELGGERHNSIARRIIIALTDGLATRPLKVGDEKYPETSAMLVAEEAKKADIQIYTIGLGSAINKGFLESIASGPDHYFAAATSKNLGTIYKEIATSICKDSPTTIEVIPLVQQGLI